MKLSSIFVVALIVLLALGAFFLLVKSIPMEQKMPAEIEREEIHDSPREAIDDVSLLTGEAPPLAKAHLPREILETIELTPPESIYPGSSVEKSNDSHQGFKDVEKELKSMLDAVVVYNVPEAPINIHSSYQIQLILDLNSTVEELKQEITEQGEIEDAEVKVSRIMEATLSGDKFSITSITPDIQIISESVQTEWRWEIHPKAEGRHNLHLTLVAMLDIDGRTTPRSIKTFDRSIEVEVTGKQKMVAFISSNWQWLWATILVPVAGWIWRQRKAKSQ
ncbi:hypothetical protein [Vibrio sp. YIC-376]|uniref:hypothetical protein n=1 Tax=Vibrio sp. YIC-376 TaxID=3136162 RepID=UPI00402AE59A